MKLGKQGAKLVIKNREIMFKIHEHSGTSTNMSFKIGNSISLDLIDMEHLKTVGLLRLRGNGEITDLSDLSEF